MRILMFGWEFPPHISGGLGTACYGMCCALSQLPDTQITFVLPKADQTKNLQNIAFEAANKVILTDELRQKLNKATHHFTYIPLGVDLNAYATKENRKLKGSPVNELYSGNYVPFSGTYNQNLQLEVQQYAVLAEEIAKQTDFDVIHAHDWASFPAAIAAKNISGKKLIAHIHATEYDRGSGSFNQEIIAIEKAGLDAADQLIAVSDYTKQMLVTKYAQPDKKISIIHNGVKLKGVTPIIPYKKGVKEKLVTFLGRITHQKGPEYFIESAELVLKKNKNVRFVLGGSGDMFTKMVEWVAQKKLSHRIHFTGFLNEYEVNALLKMSDIYVMSSRSEPFGISALEAMQAGLPVIIPNNSGVAEVIKNAVKIDVSKPTKLATAILDLLNNQEKAKKLASQGQQEAEQSNWDQVAIKIRQIYKQTITKEK